MAGFIKKNFPDCKVLFLGRSYTKDIIVLSEHVDEFINYDELEKLSAQERIDKLKKINGDVFLHVFPKKEIAQLAKQAGIPLRAGTTNRIYHWLTCNKLIKLSRKNSNLHEAQLNFKLLEFLNIETSVSLNEISSYYGFSKVPKLDDEFKKWIDPTKINIILHPKSKGSAREWGIDNFEKLVALLSKDKYKIFVSGTEQEGKLMPEFLKNENITDLTGKLSLQQFIAFINSCQVLVAASTGPLHIAAALNKKAIGLFVPKRPIHPGRWMPIGKNAHFVVFDKECADCKSGKDCNCISKINPKQIVDLLELK
ncbi:MAG: glycosyltransferase family 9 protein [Bacteroidetes bacterium]|nr:glycosyltransferase family 9 protein [Bacteroidota bacterium]